MPRNNIKTNQGYEKKMKRKERKGKENKLKRKQTKS
jgi:hypothetical protein